MLTRCLAAYGVSFAIRADSEFLLRRMESHLPPSSTGAPAREGQRVYSIAADDGASTPGYSLRADDEVICRQADLATVLEGLETHVQLHVAEMSPDHVFLHSGVIAWEDGAILLPGRTYSGKSTLVAELVRHGAGYYSDEYAVLDRSGQVHAYPRPIGLRHSGEHGVVRERVEQPAPLAGYPPLPVRAVFLCRFKAGFGWNAMRMPPGEAAVALVSHVVSARRDPARMLACLTQVVTLAPVFVAERGDAADAVAHILRATAQSP